MAIFAKGQPSANEVLETTKQRIDSPEGRRRYSQRIGIVEPVFGNIRHNKRLNRFTLRYVRSFASKAHTTRAFLLASATEATLGFRRSSSFPNQVEPALKK